MPRYFYEVTKIRTCRRRDENDPEYNAHPLREATAAELQPKQPSPYHRLFSTHSDKGLYEIIFVWELVDDRDQLNRQD